jgi:hypothetical protein
MNRENKSFGVSLLNLEMIWWLVTALVIAIILVPIYVNIPYFEFYLFNITYIVVFITFSRYVFLIKYSWIKDNFWAKVILALLCPLLILIMMDGMNQFQLFLDEKGIESLMREVPNEKWDSFYKFIRSEFLLFGVGSIIISIIFPIRMVISVWRARNSNSY